MKCLGEVGVSRVIWMYDTYGCIRRQDVEMAGKKIQSPANDDRLQHVSRVERLSTTKVTCLPKPKDALLLGATCLVANVYMETLVYGCVRSFVFGISWDSFVAHFHHIHLVKLG